MNPLRWFLRRDRAPQAKPRRRHALPAVEHRLWTRLSLEHLEDRLAPAVLHVTLGTDTGVAGELRQVVAAATANDTIDFDPSAGSSIALTAAGGGAIAIASNLTISGPGADSLTVTRADGDAGIFFVSGGVTASISGLTISDGDAGGSASIAGDGLPDNPDSVLSIDRCIVTDNTTGQAVVDLGALTITNSTISNNVGGGITAKFLTLTNSTVTGNQSNGGISLNGLEGDPPSILTNDTITGNVNAANGGGIDVRSAPVTIINCTIANNTSNTVDARSGGGGGGIYSFTANVTVINSTIVGNTAALPGDPGFEGGGGVCVDDGGMHLFNCVVAQNSASRNPDISLDVAAINSLIGDGSGQSNVFDGDSGNKVGGNGNPVLDPLLGTLADNGGPTETMALLASSPAIDAGDSSQAVDDLGNPLVTDQRGAGFDRIINGTVDMGAYEFPPSTFTVTINQAFGQPDPTIGGPVLFAVVFNQPVSDFATGDVTVTGTAGAHSGVVTGSGTNYTVTVSDMTGDGTVIATVVAGVAHDNGGDPNPAATSTDNTVTIDTVRPMVTIDQAAGQADPTSTSPVLFMVVFSEPVVGFFAGDVTLSGSAGATTADVSGSGTTYIVAVSGMTSTGTVIATLAAGVATDPAGNPNMASTSTDNTVTVNVLPLTVTVDQAVGQADPTSTSPVLFTVVFNSPVNDFVTGDVTLSGTAGATTAVVSGVGTVYTVAVSGMTASGTVIATVGAAVASDSLGTANSTSTSTDNTVTVVPSIIYVTTTDNIVDADPATITVAGLTTTPSSTNPDGLISLREAIDAANNTPGPHTIVLQNATYMLAAADNGYYGPNGLPVISSAITVEGNGAIIERDSTATNFRLFFVSTAGDLVLHNLTLRGGLAEGGDGGKGGGGGAAGMGGAIFSQGTLILAGTTLTANTAQGGMGGEPGLFSIGGGGGGLSGAGSDGGRSGVGGSGGLPDGGTGGPAGGTPGTTYGVGGDGGLGGGGGGGADPFNGGMGGFGGGGGGYSYDAIGGLAGFGGGGGGGGESIAGGFAPGGFAYLGGTGGFAGLNAMGTQIEGGGGGGGAGLGGAVFNQGGLVTISDSTLTANTASGGLGGFRFLFDPTNSHFGVRGGGFGGGLFNLYGTVSIVYSTLAGNIVTGNTSVNTEVTTAGQAGGAIYSSQYTGTATLNLTNSILADSIGGTDVTNDAGTVTGSNNLIMVSSGVPASVIASTADPKLGPLASNGGPTQTLALVLGSPAINTGTPIGAPPTDQRGVSRDANPDIGAFEVIPADLQLTNTDGQLVAVAGGPISYTLTVTNFGPTGVNGVILVDTVPASLLSPVFTPSVGSYDPGTGAWTGLSLASGQSVTMTLTGAIDVAATGTLTNTATVSPPLFIADLDPSNNTAADSDTLLPPADLSLTNTDGQTTATPGAPIAYTLTVTNNGPTTVNSLSLIDILPTALLDPVFTPSTGSYNSATGLWTGLSLAAAQSITLTLSGTVDPAAVGPLTNTATVFAPAGFGDPNLFNNVTSDTDTFTMSNNQQYVISVYRDLLGRTVDAGGLAFWSGQLDAGAPRHSIVTLLIHSDEYYANIITSAYQKFLGRTPDSAGLSSWVSQMDNGLTDEELEAGFIASPEYYTHSGGTDKSWLDAMYQNLLSRAADAGGESYWTEQLADGADRATVAYGFAASQEREGQRVTADYQKYLGRLPDPGGLSSWMDQFVNHGQTNEDLIAGFVASDEYFRMHTG